MRLLHAKCFDPEAQQAPKLKAREDIIGASENPLSYAILSHRWQEQEVLYADLKHDTALSKGGYEKLVNAIRQSRQDEYDYLWMDTCCIDKDSSAELSEAINSMYSWYMDAEVCYVYLYDVTKTLHEDGFETELSASKWFTRGWTLQELLAPSHIKFYSRDWTYIGDKACLGAIISQVTRIPLSVLSGSEPVHSRNIATRTSWAADRRTQRPEDVAYSLMGIFGVNMPMLYGEGFRAFMRLQEEIMKTTTDYTLFAWVRMNITAQEAGKPHGLLADSPQDFSNGGNVVAYEPWQELDPFSMTNKGLHIQLEVSGTLAVLPCTSTKEHTGLLAFPIMPLPGPSDRFARININTMRCIFGQGVPHSMYFPQTVTDSRHEVPAFHRISLTSRIPDAERVFVAVQTLKNMGVGIAMTPRHDITASFGQETLYAFISPPKWYLSIDTVMLFMLKPTEEDKPYPSFLLLIGVMEGGHVGWDVIYFRCSPKSCASVILKEPSFEDIKAGRRHILRCAGQDYIFQLRAVEDSKQVELRPHTYPVTLKVSLTNGGESQVNIGSRILYLDVEARDDMGRIIVKAAEREKPRRRNPFSR